jgi:DHA2 family multidrug resistance protein
MSSLTALPSAAAPVPVATPAAPAAFGLRIVVGLLGVLLAVLCAGLNEMVTKTSLADIRGGMFIGADEGAWLIAVYAAASVSAMAFSPWLAATFSLRRFTLCAISAFALLGLLQPYAPNLASLMLLRTLQGLASGALPPMLMSVALRFLPPGIKVYGLAGYALTATEPGHAAGGVVDRVCRLAVGVLADHPAVVAGHGLCGLGLASGSVAPGAFQAV